MRSEARISTTRTTRVALAASLAVLALGASAVRAEVAIGVAGGAFVPTSDLALPDQDLGIALGSTYAVTARWLPLPRLALEVRWQQVFATLDLDDPRATGSALDVDALTTGARYALRDPAATLVPWLAGHVGWYHASGHTTREQLGARAGEQTVTRRGDTIGFNVAAGVSVALGHGVSIEVEARYHYTSELHFVTPLVGLTLDILP
jgi:opacity protein-like surface antigen